MELNETTVPSHQAKQETAQRTPKTKKDGQHCLKSIPSESLGCPAGWFRRGSVPATLQLT